MAIYDLDPPNEDFNYPDSFVMLDNVRYQRNSQGICLPINVDALWKPSEGDSFRPEIWDGVLMSEILLKDEEIAQILGNLSRDGWPQVGNMKLKAAVTRACSRYPVVYCNRENDFAKQFYETHDTYNGPFRHFNSGDEWDEGKRVTLSDLNLVRIKLSLDKAVPTIVKWCCNTFHYCRDMWPFFLPDNSEEYRDAAELNSYINNLEPDQVEPTVRKKVPKVIETAKQKRERELAAMSPEDRARFLSLEATKKKVQALVRSGKIDADTYEDSKYW